MKKEVTAAVVVGVIFFMAGLVLFAYFMNEANSLTLEEGSQGAKEGAIVILIVCVGYATVLIGWALNNWPKKEKNK